MRKRRHTFRSLPTGSHLLSPGGSNAVAFSASVDSLPSGRGRTDPGHQRRRGCPALADPVPGDQPLPGYTISNPPLTPALVNGVPSTVFQGVHEHAAYNIEVPPGWNGELVMWAHGYRGQGIVLSASPPAFGLRQKLLTRVRVGVIVLLRQRL